MKTNLVFIKACVFDGRCYKHFGITRLSASLYGDKESDIIYVDVTAHNDQALRSNTSQKADYWGWYDYDKKDFTMIYPSYIQLLTCFPYGISTEEKAGKGKAYRLNVVQTQGIQKFQ